MTSRTAGLAMLLLCGSALAQTTGQPAEMRQLRAVALAAGELRTNADPTAPVVLRFAAGDVFDYYGQVDDTFGHAWSVVGDPEAFSRRESWAVLAATAEEIVSLEMADLLTALPAPKLPVAAQLIGSRTPDQVLADARAAIHVPAAWWRLVRRERFQAAEAAEILGVPAYAVPAAVVSEALELIGGRQALGPWPRDPAFGRLHVSPLLPVVWRFDGAAWELAEGGRTQRPVIGLLGNPELLPEPLAPQEVIGATLSCWTLVGGISPAGQTVGHVDIAAVAPLRVTPGARQADMALLGLSDLGSRAWPPATERLAAPRRVVPDGAFTGVLVQDNSTRQAVFLEQVIPPWMSERLRGRQLRLRVVARANPTQENVTTVTVSVEILAGDVRESVSGAVGVLPTTLTVAASIPDDAQEIRVRLIPIERSIAVQEVGAAVFESVSLTPVEWPEFLKPRPLLLRRVRVVNYDTTRRFARTPMAVSEREPGDLAVTWNAVAEGDWTEEQRRNILAGEPQPGMPESEVLLAWGEPDARAAIGGAQRWDWDDRSAAFDAEGRLIAWSREDDPELRPPARCLPAVARQ